MTDEPTNGGATMTTRRPSDKTTQVAFRLPNTMLERVDEHVQRMNEANPGLEFSRVDAVRTLLARALSDVEREAGKRGRS